MKKEGNPETFIHKLICKILINDFKIITVGDRLVDAEAAADVAVLALGLGALHQHGEGGAVRGGGGGRGRGGLERVFV